MPAPSTPRVPSQPMPAESVERDVVRTADLVLKLAALVERYESRTGSVERVAAMRDVVRRGQQQLAVLAGVDGAVPEPART